MNGKVTWTELPLAKKDILANLYNKGDRESLIEQANAFNLHYNKIETIERSIRGYNSLRAQLMQEFAATFTFPESPTPIYNKYTVIEADDAIVISDLEIPDYSVEMIQLALLTGMRYGIRRLIIAGDFLATDQQALNEWVRTYREQKELTYRNALSMGIDVIRQLFRWFTEIDMIEGNHDDRIARRTQGEVVLEMLLEGTGVNYSMYEYMYMKTSKRGVIKICHPSQDGSARSLQVGQAIYNVEDGYDPNEPTKCHIVLGHTHVAQYGFTVDGVHEVVALGCMRDPSRTLYIRKKQTKHAKWIQGFLRIQDGYFYPYTRYGTNWKDVLGDLYPATGLMTTRKYDHNLGTWRTQTA